MAFDSLFIGVTGLSAYQQQIDVISNNIANTGTTGYKGQRVTFQDLLYQNQSFASAPTQTNGGINGQEVGNGVKLGSIDTNFAPGGLATTGVNNTDLAINGDGFFVLDNSQGNGTRSYTRNGNFSLNQNGLLYDPASGMGVMGFPVSANGSINQTAPPAPIQIPFGLKSAAVATGAAGAAKVCPTLNDKVFDMTFGGNLNQADYVTAVSSGGVTNPATTISTTVYDSLGSPHLVTVQFQPATSFNAAPTTGAALTPAFLVSNASGAAVTVATEWSYIVTPTDNSDFGGGPGVATVGGFLFFDQNGQFINTSGVGSPATVADVHTIGQPASATGAGKNGNQLSIVTWNNNNGANNAATTGAGLRPVRSRSTSRT